LICLVFNMRAGTAIANVGLTITACAIRDQNQP
jgi:hypothetical protein